jgi:ketosteroid isomerase-like protein
MQFLIKIFMPIPEHYDGFTINVTDIFGSGDKAAMQGFTRRHKETGKNCQCRPYLTFKNGKITNFFQAVDTASIMNK